MINDITHLYENCPCKPKVVSFRPKQVELPAPEAKPEEIVENK